MLRFSVHCWLLLLFILLASATTFLLSSLEDARIYLEAIAVSITEYYVTVPTLAATSHSNLTPHSSLSSLSSFDRLRKQAILQIAPSPLSKFTVFSSLWYYLHFFQVRIDKPTSLWHFEYSRDHPALKFLFFPSLLEIFNSFCSHINCLEYLLHATSSRSSEIAALRHFEFRFSRRMHRSENIFSIHIPRGKFAHTSVQRACKLLRFRSRWMHRSVLLPSSELCPSEDKYQVEQSERARCISPWWLYNIASAVGVRGSGTV